MSIEERKSSHELLNEALDSSDKGMLSKAVQYSVAVALSAIAVPKGDEINALSKMNPRTPVYFSMVLAFEKRVNILLGTLRVTGKPLYPPMTFFSDVIETYMKITPSTGKSAKGRAELLLEAMQKGALMPQMDMAPGSPGFANPLLEQPQDRVDADGKKKHFWQKD